MSCTLRPIDDSLVYHVIRRRNKQQNVFHNPAHFAAFLNSFPKLKQRKPFELYGNCLFHYHSHRWLQPAGDATWVTRLANQRDLDLVIRPAANLRKRRPRHPARQRNEQPQF